MIGSPGFKADYGYSSLEVTEGDRLKIVLTPEGRELVEESVKSSLYLSELLEEALCNGWDQPEVCELGWLIDEQRFLIGVNCYGKESDEVEDGAFLQVWYDPFHMTHDPIEELEKRDHIMFDPSQNRKNHILVVVTEAGDHHLTNLWGGHTVLSLGEYTMLRVLSKGFEFFEERGMCYRCKEGVLPLEEVLRPIIPRLRENAGT